MSAPRDLAALIVDGSPFQRGLLTSLVRSAGATRVHLAENPAEGFQALRDAEPDFIVMDDAVAPGGALDFCRSLRRDDSLPNRAVPVIVLAATPTRAGIEGLRAMGVDAVLAKPCSPSAMKDKVTAIFADPRPFIVSADYIGPCRRRRQDPTYRGPLRRMSDPDPAHSAPSAYRPPEAIVEAINRLAEAAGALTAGGSVQQLVSKTLSVRAAAMECDDPDIAAAAQELMRYLEIVGATVRLSPQAVQLAIEALRQIVSLFPHERQLRARLGEGVKRMIGKKLRDAMVR